MTELREFAIFLAVVLPFYLAVAVLVIYNMGRLSDEYDGTYAVIVGLTWPLAAIAWSFEGGLHVLQAVYKRGRGHRL